MSTFSDLFGGGGGVEIIALDTFTASGTWNKPVEAEPSDLIVVDMWDGGGSGARHSGNPVSGGAPGIWQRFEFRADALPSSAPVVVGAGGAASGTTPGNPGGISSFDGYGSYSAPGGGIAHTTVGNTVPTAGIPAGNGAVPLSDAAVTVAAGAAGRNSVFCAGQGGAINLAVSAPGTSIVGGDGGAAVDGVGNGSDGQAPGGGGGGCRGGSFSGAGARGEVRVYVIRGALSVGALILPASI